MRSRAAILALSLCLLASCARALPPRTEYVLGTVCTINLLDRGSEKAYRALFDRLREIESRMSANRDDSELAAVNRSAGTAPVKVHPDLLYVAETARRYAELSGGAFDPTVGPLVKLWGIGTDRARIPEKGEISKALSLINWRDLEVDAKASTLFLKRKGMALDLGAIAKGYAADEVVRICAGMGIERAIIDLGGNVFLYGIKEDGESWRVGIQDPSGTRGDYIGVALLENQTLVTSGVYERFFEQAGRRYHHILSTSDGFPVSKGLLSVTIVAPHSIDADALSTSVFALGYEEGRRLAESIPGVQALFVFEDRSVRMTAGFAPIFSISNQEYHILAP